VSFHSVPRATADIDLWVSPTNDNAKRVFQALVAFGAPLDGVEEADFTSDDLIYMMGRPPFRVDLLTAIDGVDFATAWHGRVTGELDGEPVAFLGYDALLANKRASGRDKDLLDVRRLEEMRGGDAGENQ
jgi:hypothetical protein